MSYIYIYVFFCFPPSIHLVIYLECHTIIYLNNLVRNYWKKAKNRSDLSESNYFFICFPVRFQWKALSASAPVHVFVFVGSGRDSRRAQMCNTAVYGVIQSHTNTLKHTWAQMRGCTVEVSRPHPVRFFSWGP